MSPGEPIRRRRREGAWSGLALLASTGTLVCCALPIVLVTLGLGGVVAGATSSAPWLIELSRHKVWVFSASAALLAAAAWLMYRPGRSCPADPEKARACERLDRWNRAVLWSAVALWAVGFGAAYLALPVVRWLGG